MGDRAMVRTVREEFATRLPTTIVELILEFANWKNVARKRACLEELVLFKEIFQGLGASTISAGPLA